LNEKKTLRTPLEIEQVYPEFGSGSKDVVVEQRNPSATNQA
jgi:hypothetical protein